VATNMGPRDKPKKIRGKKKKDERVSSKWKMCWLESCGLCYA
jgi:hypothetical protein